MDVKNNRTFRLNFTRPLRSEFKYLWPCWSENRAGMLFSTSVYWFGHWGRTKLVCLTGHRIDMESARYVRPLYSGYDFVLFNICFVNWARNFGADIYNFCKY